jgi:hypothetical protein
MSGQAGDGGGAGDGAKNDRAPRGNGAPRGEDALAGAGSTGEVRLPRRQWAEMTTSEFNTMDARNCIALLPVRAYCEQNQPHFSTVNCSTLSSTLVI